MYTSVSVDTFTKLGIKIYLQKYCHVFLYWAVYTLTISYSRLYLHLWWLDGVYLPRNAEIYIATPTKCTARGCCLTKRTQQKITSNNINNILFGQESYALQRRLHLLRVLGPYETNATSAEVPLSRRAWALITSPTVAWLELRHS